MKIFFFVVALVGLVACGKNNSSGSGERKSSPDPITDNQYLSLINKYRISLGLRPLSYSLVIADVALDHSEYMATGGPFGHGGFSSRCGRLRVETGANACGEIVAMGQKDVEAVFRAWLNSPPHRRSIENPQWTHTGVGLAENRLGKKYWTQLFLKLE